MTNPPVPNGHQRASGSFDTKVSPQPPYDTADGVSLGRLTVNKTFRGPLEGSSIVEMLSAGTSVKGSAGYVAIERVVGKLDGRTGSFVLQHSGTMHRGAPTLAVSVVPDSGTGQLKGISGTMAIDITDGRHFYTFDYRVDDDA